LSAAAIALPSDDAALADLVSRGATELALPLGRSDAERLVAYVRLIERWNATYNLTAIRDPQQMVIQHILDCLAAAAALRRRRGTGRGERLIDVGSGAGLPGLVMALVFPDREVTCVDSVGKKAAFITQALGVLGLRNAQSVHDRIEHVTGQFDVIASRAFASLSDFVVATDHLLAPFGTWMALKGKTPDDEIVRLSKELAFHVEPLAVPQLAADRCDVWIDQRTEASARS
jgi:16S rRNA (guanine527-N7)-methyltransferase